MKAMERAMEENHEVVESRLTSIEGMIQRLAAAWEKKSPAANMNTVDASKGHEGTAAHDSNWWRNLELPIFDGEDPMGWLIKIERYFRLRAVREGSGDDCNGGGSFGLVPMVGILESKSFLGWVQDCCR